MFKGNAKHIFLTAAFAMILFTVPLSQIAIDLVHGDRPQLLDLFTQAPTKANLKNFEKDMEKASWFGETVRPWAQFLQFVLLKDAGQKGLLGRDGWFFYSPAVKYMVEPYPPRKGLGENGDVVSAILSFRDQLAQRQIKLLVMIAPNKASVYPDMLAARAVLTEQPVKSATGKIIADLQQAGVEVVNLFETFTQARSQQSTDHIQLYLTQDSHWSPQGVQVAAEAVAKKILDLKWAEKGSTEYYFKPVKIERLGDVLEMMQVPQIERLYQPEQIECSQVVNQTTAELYKDDPDSQILVLGDSFLRIYERDEPGSAGFIAHLANQLKQPVASVVNDGGASTLVRQQLSRKPTLIENKKIVIWEFVERDIRFGTEGWQKIPLPVTKKAR